MNKQLNKAIQLVGNEYLNNIFVPATKQDYKIIHRINKRLFDRIPYKVVFTPNDPYSNAKEMRKRVKSSNTLYIFSGGSTAKYGTDRDNLISRAVHDSFAHLICKCPFTVQGEYNAYLEQRKHYPETVHPILFAEIVGQASAFKVKGNFDFKQLAIKAPSRWIEAFKPFKRNYKK